MTRTLFGSWAMVREWGRIGQPGTVRETWFATEAEADAAGKQWRQRKEQRGYYPIGGEAKSDDRNWNRQNVMT